MIKYDMFLVWVGFDTKQFCGCTGGWHDSKVALLSAAVFAPAAVAMMINANLSKHAQERHWHGCLPVFAAGICLEYVTLVLYCAFMQ